MGRQLRGELGTLQKGMAGQGEAFVQYLPT